MNFTFLNITSIANVIAVNKSAEKIVTWLLYMLHKETTI